MPGAQRLRTSRATSSSCASNAAVLCKNLQCAAQVEILGGDGVTRVQKMANGMGLGPLNKRLLEGEGEGGEEDSHADRMYEMKIVKSRTVMENFPRPTRESQMMP